jgi:hypothetical protein
VHQASNKVWLLQYQQDKGFTQKVAVKIVNQNQEENSYE